MTIFKKKSFLISSIVVFVASLISVLPLFHKGFFVSDDGDWMIIRFTAFHQAFRDGELPVRFLGRLAQEYGYPVTNFLYPGYLYLAEPIHLLHFGFVNSIKILLLLAMVSSAVFTFLWLRKLYTDFAACTGALFYLLAPYHFYDIYRRGSVGEVLALAILPFIFWQIERNSIFWSTLGIGLLLISHNTLAVLFGVLILLYMLCRTSQLKRYPIYRYFIMLFLGFGLASFFWIPAVHDLHNTVFSKTQISDFSRYFTTFSLTGYATSLILIITGVLLLIKKEVRNNKIYVLLFSLTAALSVFLASPISTPIWYVLPVAFIQFPFRLLSLTIVGGAFLSAYCISQFGKKSSIVLSCILVVLMMITNIHLMRDIRYTDKDDAYYATNLATTTVKDEYMPVWVKQKPLSKPDAKAVILTGKGIISNISESTEKITFTVELPIKSQVQINTIYWPGWKVFVDSRDVQVAYNNNGGVITFPVSVGKHQVKALYSETLVNILSDLLSLLSFIILIVLSVIYSKKKNHAKI